ncbi:MAG: hypothetical protein AB7F43_05770 [Bacteriovoracia bacterium]
MAVRLVKRLKLLYLLALQTIIVSSGCLNASNVQWSSSKSSTTSASSSDTSSVFVTISAPTYANLGNYTAYAINGTCTEEGQSVDVSGSASFSVFCTSGIWSYSINLTSISDGAMSFTATHASTSGVSASVSIFPIKDTVAPAVAITSPAANTPFNSSITVAGTCDEPGGTLNIIGGLTASGTCSGSSFSVGVPGSGLDGSYSIQAQLADAAGNITTTSSLTVDYDTTAPSVSVSSPAGSDVPASFALSGNCGYLGTDNTTLTITGYGGPYTPTCTAGSWTQPIGPIGTDGSYSFTVTQSDSAGNISSPVVKNITVDTVSPSLSFVIDADSETTNSTSVNLDLTVSETITSSWQIYVTTVSGCSSGGTWQALSSATFSASLSATVGYQTLYAQVKDGAGNISNCASDDIIYEDVTVENVYANAIDWLDFIRVSNKTLEPWQQADVACDGTEGGYNDCVHGGLMKKVIVNSCNTCTNLSLTTSNPGLFDWVCDDNGGSGPAVFYLTDFGASHGVSDLFDFSTAAWKPLSVTINGTGSCSGPTKVSFSRAWWGTNTPVQFLPDSTSSEQVLTARGVYLSNSNVNGSLGYQISGDKITIVGSGSSSKIGGSGTANNCFFGSSRCLIHSENTKFIYINGNFEGSYGSAPDYTLFLDGVKFAMVEDIHVKGSMQANVYFLNTTKSWFTHIRTAGSIGAGLILDNTDKNRFSFLRSFNNSLEGVKLINSSGNSFMGTLSVSNGLDGVYLEDGTDNRFVATTVANNGSQGFYLNGQSAAATGQVLHNLVAFNNLNMGLLVDGPNTYDNTFSQIASTGNSQQIQVSSVNSGLRNYSGGNLLVTGTGTGSCSDTHPTLNRTFANTGTYCASGSAGNHTLSTTSLSLTSGSFLGRVVSDDPYNGNDSSGMISSPSLLSLFGWFDFYSNMSMRVWGLDYINFANPGSTGACTTGPCRIWDYALNPASTMIFKNSGSGIPGGFNQNSPFTALSPCPFELNGSDVVNGPASITYLRNAAEVNWHSRNDGDGLCESGEVCLYLPHFGAYQGEGHPVGNSCVFSNGTISNVVIFAFPTNGG